MARDDGNGWVQCRCGRPHWGRHGAAGLLLVRTAPDTRRHEVLLQLRAGWTHEGGTWGIPGGAVDSHESAQDGALREAFEEAGVRSGEVEVLASTVSTDHHDWRYVVVVARSGTEARPHAANAESVEVRWVDLEAVHALDLHPGLAATWTTLRDLVRDVAT